MKLKSMRDVLERIATTLDPNKTTITDAQRKEVEYMQMRANARQKLYLAARRKKRHMVQASRRANRAAR